MTVRKGVNLMILLISIFVLIKLYVINVCILNIFCINKYKIKGAQVSKNVPHKKNNRFKLQ